jgi:hypothetical protein
VLRRSRRGEPAIRQRTDQVHGTSGAAEDAGLSRKDQEAEAMSDELLTATKLNEIMRKTSRFGSCDKLATARALAFVKTSQIRRRPLRLRPEKGVSTMARATITLIDQPDRIACGVHFDPMPDCTDDYSLAQRCALRMWNDLRNFKSPESLSELFALAEKRGIIGAPIEMEAHGIKYTVRCGVAGSEGSGE